MNHPAHNTMPTDIKNKWRSCRCLSCNKMHDSPVGSWCGENLMGNLLWQCGPCLLKEQASLRDVKGSEKTIAGILGEK